METKIKLEIMYHHRTPEMFMGRFGGGWNWMVGFRIGGQTLIVHCLVFDIIVHWEKNNADSH